MVNSLLGSSLCPTTHISQESTMAHVLAKGRKEEKPELVNTCFGYNGKLTLILRVF